MTNDQLIGLLNELIETSKDGERGFRVSAADASDEDLKRLFLEDARRCEQSARELQEIVIRLGGDPETGDSMAGAIHRGWENLKSSLAPRENLAIVEEIERGEDYAKARYLNALREALPDDVRSVVERQCQGAVQCHDRVKAVREKLRRKGGQADLPAATGSCNAPRTRALKAESPSA